MTTCNIYGQFTDFPVEKQWWCRFDVLWIRRDHRRILNREPLLRKPEWQIASIYPVWFSAWIIDWKVINN